MSGYTLFDIVKVIGNDPAHSRMVGLEGYVGGISDATARSTRSYAVFLYALETVWMLKAEHLEGTGRRDSEAENEIRPSVRVIVDPVTFEGRIASDDQT